MFFSKTLNKGAQKGHENRSLYLTIFWNLMSSIGNAPLKKLYAPKK